MYISPINPYLDMPFTKTFDEPAIAIDYFPYPRFLNQSKKEWYRKLIKVVPPQARRAIANQCDEVYQNAAQGQKEIEALGWLNQIIERIKSY